MVLRGVEGSSHLLATNVAIKKPDSCKPRLDFQVNDSTSRFRCRYLLHDKSRFYDVSLVISPLSTVECNFTIARSNILDAI